MLYTLHAKIPYGHVLIVRIPTPEITADCLLLAHLTLSQVGGGTSRLKGRLPPVVVTTPALLVADMMELALVMEYLLLMKAGLIPIAKHGETMAQTTATKRR